MAGVALLLAGVPCMAQQFIAGADVSFLRQMELSRGVIFRDAGVQKPGLQILKDHGYTWIRLRIMVNPVSLPNGSLQYTIASAKDAKALGFKFLLDFHYSNDWADPAHQTVPRAWAQMSHEQLVNTTFHYTRDTIQAFRRAEVSCPTWCRLEMKSPWA